jgi:transcriptional regulator with PAS, ATPase and Fis domain
MALRVVSGPDAGREGSFDDDVVRIGANEGNHLVLNDATVSRVHAEVVRTPDGIVLRDCGSTNGTFVGEVRVREVFLPHDRVFRVGKTEVLFGVLDEVVDVEPAKESQFEDLVGGSVAMRQVYSVLEKVAPTGLTVLVSGETGTGKELVSRAIHARSRRARGPFVVFDCGAVARSLVEAELFGHEKGAFTGAVASRPGVFEAAHGGTIFLDELGELPLEVQPTLLRVLEQREVRRVGDRRARPVDVRVVAATNRDLHRLVVEGRFREDLYYRLGVVEVKLPPLRERLEDLSMLVERLLHSAGFPHRVRGIDAEVERILRSWHWPGNVRELRNVLTRAIPFAEGPLIGLAALPEALQAASRDADPPTEGGPDEAQGSFHAERDRLLGAFERRYLEDLMERCSHNLSRASRDAGIDRKTLTRMLRRQGLADGG